MLLYRSREARQGEVDPHLHHNMAAAPKTSWCVRTQEAAGPSRVLQEPQQHEWRKYIEIRKWSERYDTWVKTLNLPIQLTEGTANIKDACYHWYRGIWW